MANTLDQVKAPLTTILTDKGGTVGAEVVSATPSVGQTGLVTYPVPNALVTQTQDGADGTTGANVPATAIQIGGAGADGKLHAISTDNTGKPILGAGSNVIGHVIVDSGAGNASVGTTGSAVPASATAMGGAGIDGNLHDITTDNMGNLRIVGGTTVPVVVQTITAAKAAASSVSQAFGSNVAAGNTIVVVAAIDKSSGTPLVTCSDNLNNSYTCVSASNGQNMTAVIFYGTVLKSGACTVIFTLGSSVVSALTLYEVAGLGVLDTTNSNNSAGTTAPSLTMNQAAPNSIAFMALAVASSATISVNTASAPPSATLDSTSLAVSGGTALTTFGAISASLGKPQAKNTALVGTPNTTLTMAATLSGSVAVTYAMCVFKPAASVVTGSIGFTTAPGGALADAASNNPVIVVTEPISTGANPQDNTAAVQVGYPFVYNGVTWDRLRGTWNTVTGDAPTIASATTTNGATQTNYNNIAAIITVILGAVSGTTPTLKAQLQWSPDGGTTWITYGTGATANSVATGNTLVLTVMPGISSLTFGGTFTQNISGYLPRTWRLAYITTGTGISIAIASVQVNYVGT